MEFTVLVLVIAAIIVLSLMVIGRRSPSDLSDLPVEQVDDDRDLALELIELLGYRFVEYLEQDGTHGVYVMDKKHNVVAYAVEQDGVLTSLRRGNNQQGGK